MPKIIKKRSEHNEAGEENIQETIEDIRDRFKHKQRVLVYVLIAFIVAASAITAFVVYSKTSSANAANFASEGYAIYYDDQGPARQLPVQEKAKKALELFKKSYDAKETAYVLLLIANCHYDLGKYDEAINSLTELTRKFSDPMILPLAYYKLAMAYGARNDSANALAALKKVTEVKNGPLGDLALMESGKIYETQGRTQEAQAIFRELIAKYPASPFLNEAKAKVGEK